jgi:hypothetical protein
VGDVFGGILSGRPHPVVMMCEGVSITLTQRKFSSKSRNPIDAEFPSRFHASVTRNSCTEEHSLKQYRFCAEKFFPLTSSQRSVTTCDNLWQHPPSPGLLRMESCLPEGV